VALAHISRKELKKDELRDTLAQGAEAVLSHQSLTLYIVIAAAVIALGFFGWRSYTERQTVKAAAAYNDAMKVFQARVRAPGEPQEPNEVSYVDAKKWLKGLADGDSDFAAMAKFELAQLADRNGQGDEAVSLYQQLMAKPGVLVPKPVVMLALAGHYSQKNPAEAAKLYAQIKSEYPDTPIANEADQELALLPGKS
jgi:predicted negative regulator of RcsB-dependent stress response